MDSAADSAVQLRTYLSGFLFPNVDNADGARHYAECRERNRNLVVFMTVDNISSTTSQGCPVAVLLCSCHAAIAIWPSPPTVERWARLQTMVLKIPWHTELNGSGIFHSSTKRLTLSPKRWVAKIQLQSASPRCRRLWNSDRILLWLQSPAVPPTQTRSGKQCRHYKSRQRLP